MRNRELLICLSNAGYEASLEVRKLYVATVDKVAGKRGFRRVIDESGEDYLYPDSLFVPAKLPAAVRRAVLQAA